MSTKYLGLKTFAAILLYIMLCSTAALAISTDKTVEYTGGKMGKVFFSGQTHRDAGYKCLSCHNKIFVMKQGHATISYVNHSERKEFCFACHNGKAAFDAVGNCYRCHKRL